MAQATSPMHVAIDLGAGSGRALVGGVGPSGLRLTEVHRFHYAPRRLDGRLRWDTARLIDGLRASLVAAARAAAGSGGTLSSVGVDSWGVDYALIDQDGELVEDPVCYRDDRTDGAMDAVFDLVPRDVIFARTGIQFHQFNTLFQLWAHTRTGIPARAARLLLVPDLCHHLLCGSTCSERTNASTTQLLGTDGAWDDWLFDRLDLPRALMPDVVVAGTRLGALRPAWCRDLGLPTIDVVAPGTHDTASAVAGTPLDRGSAFISSGTWSLVGVECEAPVLSPAAARAGLTNEAGVFGTTRLLTNVMGLWLLESCRREWASQGHATELTALLSAAASVPDPVGVVHPDDHRFFAPASMVGTLREVLTETGQPAPDDPVLLTKIILDSLALRYAEVVARLEDVTGRPIPCIHIVGGGSLNGYLNQATADASGRSVRVGPVEATATGNLLVQAITAGGLRSLEDGRRQAAEAFPIVRLEPRDPGRWARTARTYRDLAARAEREHTR